MAYSGRKVIKRSARTGEIVAIYPSVKVAAAVEGVCEETIRSWCLGRVSRDSILHTYEYITTEKQKAAYAKKEGDAVSTMTLCWQCDNACGGCSWSRSFIPVEGWTATRRDMLVTTGTKNDKRISESYIVHDCPEFVPDPPLEERKKQWSEWI